MGDGLCMVVVVPHPPIIVSEIGGSRGQPAANLLNAVRRLAERILRAGLETAIIISPHGPISPDAFGIHVGDVLRGSFAHFGCPSLSFHVENDLQLVDEIIAEAYERRIKIFEIPDGTPLDHGVLVPVYFLTQAGWRGKVIALSCSLLPVEEHLEYGRCIARAVAAIDRRAVFVASADLGRQLAESAPSGHHPQARLFDELVTSSIASGDFDHLAQVERALCERSGECGYRPLLVSLGAAGMQPVNNQVLSYECPFGVGYIVAVLVDRTGAESRGEYGSQHAI